MRFFEAEADIASSPEKVWKLLTDAPGYPAWNPTVERIEGTIGPEQTIKCFVKVNPGRTFPLKVTHLDPSRRMVWSGGMPLGLFKGERTFDLASAGNGTVRFTMREEYTGPMLPLVWRSIPDLTSSFREFAQALKAAAEKGDD